MSMFKLNDVLICLISWGVASLFKMRGRHRGGGLPGANWRLSIDACRKYHFIWGLKGDGFLTEGSQAPSAPTLSDYVPCVGVYAWQQQYFLSWLLGLPSCFWGVERRHQEIGRCKEEFKLKMWYSL